MPSGLGLGQAAAILKRIVCVAIGTLTLLACARSEHPDATTPAHPADTGRGGSAEPAVPPPGGTAPADSGSVDPAEANRALAMLDVSDAPERPICDGSDTFTFQRANWNRGWEGSAFGVLWRNGYAYLRVDGHCRYYAYQGMRPDPVVTGMLSGEEATQLAADVEYAGWPLLDGLTATGGTADNALEQLYDGKHALFCARGCRWGAAPQDEEAAARLTPWFDAADEWRQRLLERGTPLQGDVRLAIELKEDIIHSGGYLEWPLAEPIETFLVAGNSDFEEAAGPDESPAAESASVSDGILFQGEDAERLRTLRAEALRTATPGAITEGWIAIDAPGEMFYEVVVADALPYEGADGRVPRH